MKPCLGCATYHENQWLCWGCWNVFVKTNYCKGDMETGINTWIQAGRPSFKKGAADKELKPKILDTFIKRLVYKKTGERLWSVLQRDSDQRLRICGLAYHKYWLIKKQYQKIMESAPILGAVLDLNVWDI